MPICRFYYLFTLNEVLLTALSVDFHNKKADFIPKIRNNKDFSEILGIFYFLTSKLDAIWPTDIPLNTPMLHLTV